MLASPSDHSKSTIVHRILHTDLGKIPGYFQAKIRILRDTAALPLSANTPPASQPPSSTKLWQQASVDTKTKQTMGKADLKSWLPQYSDGLLDGAYVVGENEFVGSELGPDGAWVGCAEQNPQVS